MTLFSSLTNRIFFATAFLAVLAIAVAVYRVNVAVTQQAENELRRGLNEARTLLDEYRTALFEHFAREARLIADLPKIKAALETRHPPTVQPIVDDYQQQIQSDLFAVTDRAGSLLAEAGRLKMPTTDPAVREAVARAVRGQEVTSLWPYAGGVIQVVTVPSQIAAAADRTELLGTVSVGFSLDEAALARFKALTNSEIAFAVGNRIKASTLDPQFNDELAALIGAPQVRRLKLGGTEFEAVSLPLPIPASSAAVASAVDITPTALVLRSRTERLQFLNIVHRELAVAAILAVLLATVLSYAVARTITRPLGAITATMREMAATGDLTRKIQLASAAGWEDEDARLLATTFNTMTDSIGRFQREAAQRERLLSLGRLSTVVAHEIRNPLMIIKTALRTLRHEQVAPEDLRAAVTDIDEEIARLNRIVSEVLDFARPIKFELAPADVNQLCEDAARASAAESDAAPVALRLDRTLPPVVTDAERLRLALINILTNARHAVAARNGNAAPPDAITISTQRTDSRCAIRVTDRGNGIAAEDLPRVFDPYFTTRRTGTGLGLAISRNIIEGLGGTIAVQSRPGEGTDVRIELPLRS
jgi:signal transduction histidine kinase